jgi:hypothetical protein
MNREDIAVLEKPSNKEPLYDRRRKFSSFFVPVVIYERRKSPKETVSMENITEPLTATYWG